MRYSSTASSSSSFTRNMRSKGCDSEVRRPKRFQWKITMSRNFPRYNEFSLSYLYKRLNLMTRGYARLTKPKGYIYFSDFNLTWINSNPFSFHRYKIIFFLERKMSDDIMRFVNNCK